MSQAMALSGISNSMGDRAGEGPVHGAGGQPLIRIGDLAKSFPLRRPWAATLRHPLHREQVSVLRGVSLDVREGEFFGLLGPNGAGKTTLFKILATLVLPDAGSVTVAGKSVVTDPKAVRGLLTPVIADERSLYWRLSGRQNLDLYAALYGVPSTERERTAERLLGAVGLEHAGSRMVGTYSSGMKQRLLIARALLSRPAVLLLDEPTRSLDPVSARDFRQFLREEIVGRQGCTVLLATHDADEAFELCDRLAVLDRGAVVAQGTVSELAGLAGENRYRVLVDSAQAADTLLLINAWGLDSFEVTSSPESGWSYLEGPIPGGAAACASLTHHLVAGGMRVAEVARVPLSLAGMIERLVATGPR
jgi:ABC-2 type transport system ATP-binding protein